MARDFYRTPRKAALPLIPFLRGIKTFSEPCCGDRALVRHLVEFGLVCVYAGDIATGQDALAVNSYGGAEINVTNPPFKRELLYRLIPHFMRIAPTWLLLPIDFASNQKSAELMRSCSDVVPIGRVKWFEDSEFGSMDNFGWFRFDARCSARAACP
jgi:hypothetical protein